MRSDRIFTLLFALLFVNEVCAGFWRDTYEWWYLLSKPALLLSILVYFVLQTRSFPHPFRNLLIAGFAFSWFGDGFLMFQAEDEVYFLLGLVSFFFAHIAYILAFRLWFYDNHEVPLLKKSPWLAFVLMLYGLGFFKLIDSALGDMKLPVIAYMAVILLMSLMALNRYKKVSRRGYALVLAGALAFLLSDSILAYNKFMEPLQYAGVWIMATYCFAQWAIMMGGLIELRVAARQS